MVRGKYLSLEDARKKGQLDRFCKEHPSEGDRQSALDVRLPPSVTYDA